MAEQSVQLIDTFRVVRHKEGDYSLQHDCPKHWAISGHISSIDRDGLLRIVNYDSPHCANCDKVIPEEVLKKVKFITQGNNQ